MLGDYWLCTGRLLLYTRKLLAIILEDYCFILGDYWLYTGSLLYSVTSAVQCFNRPHQGKLCFPLMLQFQGWLGWLCPRPFIIIAP